ncbi:MAG: hypothetical protein ACXVBT_15760 [Flavisolibacter sp.]
MQEEPLFSATLTEKFYNERAVLLATFLGGPLAGAWLMASNFKAMGETVRATRTWVLAVMALVLVFLLSLIPSLDKIPAISYSFAFCWTARFLTRKYQGPQIQLHQENGGQFYTTWRAVGIGLIGMAVVIVIILVLLFLGNPTFS